jgi:hypothetical protein
MRHKDRLLLEDRLLLAVGKWASHHPSPNEPALMMGSGFYSPLEIWEELKRKTPTGQLIMKVLEHSVRLRSAEAVLTSFERPRVLP